MKIKLLFALLLVSFFAVAQPTNYQKISARYRWIAGMFDSSITVPSGITPSLRGGGWNGPGAIFFNTADSSLYVYSGYNWRKMGATPTLQQVLTAGSTLTTDNTIDFGGNDFILKGDSVVIKDPSGNERIRLLPNGNPSEGDATKIKLTNIDGATMIIQTGDEYLETLTGWVIRNTIGYNPVLSVNGASTGQTSPLIEVIQNLNDSIFTIISSGNVGIGDRTPDTSSLLDVSSTSKGVLIPRMTTTQRNAISLPAIGLMIYNTTDSAFNFYRTSGWSAIGGGSGSYTFSNGLTEAAGVVKLGGTITENTQIYPDTEDAYNLDIGDPTTFRNIGIYAKNQLYIGTTNPATDWSSEIHFYDDSLVLRPGLRKLYVDSLDYTLSTTGKKILLRDTASGLVQNIDPALLVSTPTLQQVLTAGSTLTGNNTINGGGNSLIINNTSDITIESADDINITSTTTGHVKIASDVGNLHSSVKADNSGSVYILAENDSPAASSLVTIYPDSITQKPFQGNYYIDSLNSGVITDSIMVWRKSDGGSVRYIDPALLGGGSTNTSVGSGYKVAIDATNNIKSLTGGYGITLDSATSNQVNFKLDSATVYSAMRPGTNTLATFGAGAGLSTDTAAFQTTSIYGSFYNDGNDTLIITKVIGVLQGSSPSITPTIYFNDSLNITAGATKLVNSPSALTNTTTGTAVTSFDNYKIPPGVWVWVATPTVGTKPTYFSMSLIGYKKRV